MNLYHLGILIVSIRGRHVREHLKQKTIPWNQNKAIQLLSTGIGFDTAKTSFKLQPMIETTTNNPKKNI